MDLLKNENLISLFYDLHIHSCLSPCGDDDMTPGNIVGMSVIKGLDVIAVTDHNSCKNCKAVLKHAEEYGIIAIPGMEICTLEEIHALCLFRTLEQAVEFDKYVYEKLIKVENNEDIFGKQQIYDEEDNEIGRVEFLLINGADISFDYLHDLVYEMNGIMIPAHLDKSTTSLISNYGFVPPDSKFSCFELKKMSNLHVLCKDNPYLNQCNVITNSDAHYLEDINEAINTLYVSEKSIDGVFAALTRMVHRGDSDQ